MTTRVRRLEIDAELGELVRRRAAALDLLARTLADLDAMAERADILLDRRASALK